MLGRNFNVTQYSSLHHKVAMYCGLNIGSFCLNSINTHIYEKHIEGAKTYVKQWDDLVNACIENNEFPQYPILLVDPDIKSLSPKEFLDTLSTDMVRLTDYKPQPAIKLEVTK